MQCDNHFCIYWSEKECSLQVISLDMQGGCRDCIYVSIDEKLLKQMRERALRSYEEQYARWEKIDKTKRDHS